MRKSVVVLLTIFFTAGGANVFGQTAERIETILDQENMTVGQAAYIAAASAGMIDESDSGRSALDALSESGSGFSQYEEDEQASLGLYSHMLMTAFDREGGMLYSLFPGPRYALRELEFERVVQGGGDPPDPISGRRALQLVSRLRAIVAEEQ